MILFFTEAIFFIFILYANGSILDERTNSNDLNLTSNFLINLTQLIPLIASIAATIGLPVSLITFYYQKKQQKFNALIEVFQLLNNEEHRQARAKVYDVYKQFSEGNVSAFKENQSTIAMVRADFDQMGTLIDNNLIPKKIFLEVYWHTILISWKALEKNIEDEIRIRANPSYMKYFKKLKDEAENYWQKNHPEVKYLKIY